MKALALIPIVLLAGCATTSAHKAADEYSFEKGSFTHTDITLKVVLVPNQLEMTTLLKERSLKSNMVYNNISVGKQVFAFSAFSPSNNTCTIYMIDPKVDYQPERIGHELVHCIYGDWHHHQD